MGLSSQTHGTVLLTVSIALKFQSKSEVSQIKETGIEFNETEGSPVLKGTTSIRLLGLRGETQKGTNACQDDFCAFLEMNFQSSERHFLCFGGMFF